MFATVPDMIGEVAGRLRDDPCDLVALLRTCTWMRDALASRDDLWTGALMERAKLRYLLSGGFHALRLLQVPRSPVAIRIYRRCRPGGEMPGDARLRSRREELQIQYDVMQSKEINRLTALLFPTSRDPLSDDYWDRWWQRYQDAVRTDPLGRTRPCDWSLRTLDEAIVRNRPFHRLLQVPLVGTPYRVDCYQKARLREAYAELSTMRKDAAELRSTARTIANLREWEQRVFRRFRHKSGFFSLPYRPQSMDLHAWNNYLADVRVTGFKKRKSRQDYRAARSELYEAALVRDELRAGRRKRGRADPAPERKRARSDDPRVDRAKGKRRRADSAPRRKRAGSASPE